MVYRIINSFFFPFWFLVGKMIMEMGDQSTVKCESLDLICELEFKTKVNYETP